MDQASGLNRGNILENKEQLKKRILLADDNKVFLEGIAGILKEMGYAVSTASNGKELLDKLTSGEKFDAVLSDNNMSQMKGIEVLEKVRQITELKKMPFMLQTLIGNSKLEERVKNLGGRYLEKSSLTFLEDLEKILKEELEEKAQ